MSSLLSPSSPPLSYFEANSRQYVILTINNSVLMSAGLKGIIFNFYPYVSYFSVYAESVVLGPLHLFSHGPFKSPTPTL